MEAVSREQRSRWTHNFSNYHELNIFGVYHHTPYYVRKALDIIIGGDMNTSAFISDTLPLSQLLEAFAKVKALKGIKYAVDPRSPQQLMGHARGAFFGLALKFI